MTRFLWGGSTTAPRQLSVFRRCIIITGYRFFSYRISPPPKNPLVFVKLARKIKGWSRWGKRGVKGLRGGEAISRGQGSRSTWMWWPATSVALLAITEGVQEHATTKTLPLVLFVDVEGSDSCPITARTKRTANFFFALKVFYCQLFF